MALPDRTELTVAQTRQQPMETLDKVRDHAAAVRRLVSWDRVGVLMDEGPEAVVTALLAEETVVCAARFSLSVEDSVAAIGAYGGEAGETELRCWQGHTMTTEQLVDLDKLTGIWRKAATQRSEQRADDWKEFFARIEEGTRQKGRGASVGTNTRQEVLLAAHGRCMFEGCGVDLTEDAVTGKRGNFATLAHNVASSEGGTRGVLFLSGQLADDPENFLLLCDVHHRLVDTVAKADYPAARLTEMRRRFCEDAGALLDGLALVPVPAYCVVWPVHQQVISVPSSREVAWALKPIGARLDGHLQSLGTNDPVGQSPEPETFWAEMCTEVGRTARGILMQAHNKGYRAALFAMGLMPALIALGARLGNKCEITPMLRYREQGLWYWPEDEPRGECYTIDGMDGLSEREDEVCLLLGLTAVPRVMRTTAESLGWRTVSLVASAAYLGNGALGHPADGNVLRQRIQELLHRLRDAHGVRRVHVLPCASNAACVFFGQAFDSYHPELVVYDFETGGGSMVARLRIRNVENACVIEAVGACT